MFEGQMFKSKVCLWKLSIFPLLSLQTEVSDFETFPPLVGYTHVKSCLTEWILLELKQRRFKFIHVFQNTIGFLNQSKKLDVYVLDVDLCACTGLHSCINCSTDKVRCLNLDCLSKNSSVTQRLTDFISVFQFSESKESVIWQKF